MTTAFAEHAAPLRERVAAEVRAFMARHGLTQVRMAQLLNWRQPYLSRRLTGSVAFDTDDLAQLGDLFDVPPEEFLRGPASPGKRPGANFVHCLRDLFRPFNDTSVITAM